jgi:D-arabinose 1-dehydrogenase-like Zn-dependent alcohol dehydrogenase
METNSKRMSAMRLHATGSHLSLDTVAQPDPAPSQVLLEVLACGVCRTDLHVVDGELPQIPHPITPGHEIVGRVVARGDAVTGLQIGLADIHILLLAGHRYISGSRIASMLRSLKGVQIRG